MCGVVGIITKENAQKRALNALSRLEYRGYDSAGIASTDGKNLTVTKAVGKVDQLKEKLVENPVFGDVCIGHMRWATHGVPSEKNAHPIVSGGVAVVHNGIIENYKVLKEELVKEGANFVSDTDTEVISQLLNKAILSGLQPVEAILDVVNKINGSFAICAIFKDFGNLLIGVKNKSPLVVGYGKSAPVMLCSDAIGLVDTCDKVLFLDDKEIVVATSDEVKFLDFSGKELSKTFTELTIDASSVAKDGYDHFMLKEIMEQPLAIQNSLKDISLPSDVKKVTILACGSSYYAGCVAKYWMEKYLRIQTNVELASEFIYRDIVVDNSELFLAISQSGETSDTIAAVSKIIDKADVGAIVNVKNSTLARMSKFQYFTEAGPEIGVASTKSFIAQLAILSSLTFKEKFTNELKSVAGLCDNILRSIVKEISEIAKDLTNYKNAIFLGRGLMYPIAQETALKVKELTYIHAEAFAGGELKHGPLALIDDNIPVYIFAPSGKLFEKTASNVNEVLARGKNVTVFTDNQANISLFEGAKVVQIPHIEEDLAPFTFVLIGQLLSYYAANFLGHDVDRPRNLAKSVTVE